MCHQLFVDSVANHFTATTSPPLITLQLCLVLMLPNLKRNRRTEMRDATKVVQALELMAYLSILSLHTLAPSLEATL